MGDEARPGPKPKRAYLRVVEWGPESEPPAAKSVRAFVQNLDRVGRLVAHGNLTRPAGDLLVLRAEDLAEAERVLRTDPSRGGEPTSYRVLEWNVAARGPGVNLDPPPPLGSGRLTLLQRVTVVVRDRAAAVDWYRRVLGFTVRRHDEETGFVELSLAHGTVGIALVQPRPEWGEPYYSEATSRVGTATGIVFETDSVEALGLRLQHASARVTQPPQSQPWGGVTLRFTDPDGNEFLAFQAKVPRPAKAGSHPPEDGPRTRHRNSTTD